MSLQDSLKDMIHFGIGSISLIKEKMEKEFDELIKSKKLTKDEIKAKIDKIFEKGQEEEEELKNRLKESIKEALNELGVATKADIEELKKELKPQN